MSKDFRYYAASTRSTSTLCFHEELVEMALDFSEDSSNRANIGGDGIIWDNVGADIYLALAGRKIKTDPEVVNDALLEAASIMNVGV